MLFDDELKGLFEKVKTIAIIGAKDKPGHPVDMVGRYLIEAGYDVIPVHPVRKTVWGLKAYPTVFEVDRPIDMVDLFRAPQFCPNHAHECLKLKSKPLAFWMQSGIKSPEAAEILADSDIQIFEDACTMVEHKRVMR